MRFTQLNLSSFVYLLPLFMVACATPGKGNVVVTKPGSLEFTIGREADSKKAQRTLKKAAYDICRTTTNQNFKIQSQEEKPTVLVAKVDCIGTIDPFTSTKYGSRQKIMMQPSGELPGRYNFSY